MQIEHVSAADIAALAKGKRVRGGYMIRCPAIGHDDKNPSCKVYDGPDGNVMFHCFRCDWRDVRAGAEALGWIPEFEPGKPRDLIDFELREAKRLEREAEDKRDQERRLSTAQYLWSRRRPAEGTIVETYLRKARGYEGPIPPTIGFLPQYKPDYHTSMIAAFGIPDEPEPGRLSLRNDNVRGVHLTHLKPDGSGKIETKPDKKMFGSSTGWPIVLAPMNDLLGLCIGEGIENTLSVLEVLGTGAWAATTAGRMPALADKVPAWTDCVVIAGDAGEPGEPRAYELAEKLAARNIAFELAIPNQKNRRAA